MMNSVAGTRKDIARLLADRSGISQEQAKTIVDLTFDAMTELLCETGRLELRNFGVFKVRLRKPRKARNVRQNTAVSLPAKQVVTFQPGKLLAAAVADIPMGKDVAKGVSSPVPLPAVMPAE